jgi:acetyl esterase/lipase
MTGIDLAKRVFVLVAIAGLFATIARAADQNDVIGKWKLRYEPGDGQTRDPVLTVTKNGPDLKGECAEGDQKSTVNDLRFQDGKLSFRREGQYNGAPASATFEGQVKGDVIEGECRWEYRGMSGSFPFTGKREAAAPKGGGRTAGGPSFVRAEDIVYGRKFGTALTMDIFTPREHVNGLGIILVVSGGWFSAHEAIQAVLVERLTARGYTVFAVVHGSQPKFTIPEILQDMNRAVRFIRFHARDYKIDPDCIGIYGGSAGGHLSLMQGTAGDRGNPDSRDPVERISSRVQAVACFFPPTDFLNYGKPGENALGRGVLAGFKAPFDFHERDAKTGTFERVTDEAKILEIGKQISPITHVSADDPPTLIIHGDADKLVPIQQAESFVAKLKEAGVEAKLVVKPGAGHGWADLPKDMELLADWFDRHLKKD